MSKNRDLLSYIFGEISKRGYGINIVSNGVDLDGYIQDLVSYNVESVQITIDGPPEIHNKRRVGQSIRDSFSKILSNINIATSSGIKIIIRTNVDMENVYSLPDLAEILHNEISNISLVDPYLYLMQDGGCAGEKNVISENVAIESILDPMRKNPIMRIFRTKFHGIDLVNGIFKNTPFSPRLRHCSAPINQYILDCDGHIYKCWHGIGNTENSVGMFSPDICWNDDLKSRWSSRDALKIEKCRTCLYRYVCGGGCPAASHISSYNPEMISRESCVDYGTILRSLILHNDHNTFKGE